MLKRLGKKSGNKFTLISIIVIIMMAYFFKTFFVGGEEENYPQRQLKSLHLNLCVNMVQAMKDTFFCLDAGKTGIRHLAKHTSL